MTPNILGNEKLQFLCGTYVELMGKHHGIQMTALRIRMKPRRSGPVKRHVRHAQVRLPGHSGELGIFRGDDAQIISMVRPAVRPGVRMMTCPVARSVIR